MRVNGQSSQRKRVASERTQWAGGKGHLTVMDWAFSETPLKKWVLIVKKFALVGLSAMAAFLLC